MQVGDRNTTLKHVFPYATRTLVAASINPANNNEEVLLNFPNKLAGFFTRLHQCKLPHIHIYFGHKTYWWVALKYMAPALTLPVKGNILQ